MGRRACEESMVLPAAMEQPAPSAEPLATARMAVLAATDPQEPTVMQELPVRLAAEEPMGVPGARAIPVVPVEMVASALPGATEPSEKMELVVPMVETALVERMAAGERTDRPGPMARMATREQTERPGKQVATVAMAERAIRLDETPLS